MAAVAIHASPWPGECSYGRGVRRPGVKNVDPNRAVALAAIAAILGIQLVFFGLPLGLWLHGLVLGGLNAVMAVGMALIYRANRVVNFAQAELGTVPTAFAASFILFWGWPYLLGLASGLIIAVVAGVVIEFALIRRFRNSPRLVVTVATLGITQLLVVIGILIPRWWGRNLASERIAPPVGWKLTVGAGDPQRQPPHRPRRRAADDGRCRLVPGQEPLRRRHPGQCRARRSGGDARHPGRPAQHAGVGHRRGHVVRALFLRSGIIGVPLGYAVGLPALLQALAALVIGRLERLPTIAAAAIALGLLESGVRFNSDTPGGGLPDHGAVMFVVLLVQRSSDSRRDNDAASTWRGAEEVRPLASADRRSSERARHARGRSIIVGLGRRDRRAVRARRRLHHQGVGDLRVRDHRAVAGGAHRLGRADLARSDGHRRHRRSGQRHLHRRDGTST